MDITAVLHSAFNHSENGLFLAADVLSQNCPSERCHQSGKLSSMTSRVIVTMVIINSNVDWFEVQMSFSYLGEQLSCCALLSQSFKEEKEMSVIQ